MKDSEENTEAEFHPYGLKLSGGITLRWPPVSPQRRWFGPFTPGLTHIATIVDLGDLLDEDLRQLINPVPYHRVAGT